jgi:pyruvate,water dikinase
MLRRWDPAVANDVYLLLLTGLLELGCQKWVGDLGGTLASELLGGDRSSPSLEPARRIRTMAILARQNAALTESFRTGSLAEIETRLCSDPRLKAACDDFLEQFGGVCLEEFKLESPTLGERSLPLYRAIGHAALRAGGPELAAFAPARTAAEQRIQQPLEGHPFRRVLFRWLLGRTRKVLRARDELRLGKAQLFGRIRLLFLEMGRQLSNEGHLDDPQDVFHLTAEEILGFVEGTGVTTDLRSLVGVRRHEFERWRKSPAPADRLETLGAVHIGNRLDPREPGETRPPASDILQGIGCSPGVVRGRARRIDGAEGFDLEPGRILVAEQAEPGWLLRSPAAAGLLIEGGHSLSPCVLVAREVNIPAIAALTGLNQWVKDGDWVEIDGSGGTVRRVQPPAYAS